MRLSYFKKKINVCIRVCFVGIIFLFGMSSAYAVTVNVETDSNIINFGSITLGDYQLSAVGIGNGNLIDGSPDFAVVNDVGTGSSLLLSRIDGAEFDVNSITAEGSFSASIGGVIINPTQLNFQIFPIGLTNITSLLMTPFGSSPPSSAALKVSAFDVNISAVPIPAALWLFGAGLIGLMGIRKTAATN